MKNHFLLLLSIVIVSLTSSCGSNEKGTVITAEQFENLRADKANAGKRFSIVGYPAVGGDLLIGANQRAPVFIRSMPDGTGDVIGVIDIRHGKDKNEMFVPEKFTNADLIVYDNTGAPLSTKDKIMVSFTVELDTNRDMNEQQRVIFKNGKAETKKVKSYFGEGPVDIRIDKAN